MKSHLELIEYHQDRNDRSLMLEQSFSLATKLSSRTLVKNKMSHQIVVIDNAYEPCKRKMTSKLICLLACLAPRLVVVQTLKDFNSLDQAQVAGYVLTGSHHRLSIKDASQLPTLFLNLAALASGKPVLGICFGFQFMTWLEGAPIVQRRCPQKGLGPSCFPSLQQTLFLYYHCYDAPAWIPSIFNVRAFHPQSHEGQVIQHKVKSWFGVLFHPEVSGEFGRRLLQNFIKLALNR